MRYHVTMVYYQKHLQSQRIASIMKVIYVAKEKLESGSDIFGPYIRKEKQWLVF